VTAAGAALLVALVAAAPLGAQAAPSSASTALTLAEVLQLRRSGVPNAQILQNAREYCLAFTVADSAERELRMAGADSTLLEGLRGACRPAGAPVVLAARPFVDDDFKSTRRLPVSTLRAQACRSRYDAEGFFLSSDDGQLGCTVGYPAEITGDARIEITVAMMNGPDATVALGFGRDRYSWDRWSFNVQANGRFELCRFAGPRCTRLLPPMNANSLWRRALRAENQIAVELRGRVLQVFINDVRVGEALLASEPTGQVVLGVGPRSSVSFRRLRVTRFGE